MILAKKPYRWKDGEAILGEHSRQKHKILAEYFRQYLLERCKTPKRRSLRMAIVDGFAGGGQYGDGSPGSPLIFINVLKNTVNEINVERAVNNLPVVEIECLLILNDVNQDAVSSLRETVGPYQAALKDENSHVNLHVEYHQEEFEAAVDHFIAKIENGRYRNIVYNLDQCGYVNINRDTISRLLRSERSVEIFLTYAVDALLAFLSQKNPVKLRQQLKHLSLRPESLDYTKELMSKKEWLGTTERIVFEHFGDCASFVTPFSIHNPEGWRYWFMHFARHHHARRVYNDVLHEMSSEQAHYGRAGLRMLSYNPNHETGSLYLFDRSGRKDAREQLIDDIPRFVFDGGDSIGMSEFYHSIYNETPAHSDDINKAIILSDDLEILTPTGGERRTHRTIKLDDTLRLKKQRRFYFPDGSSINTVEQSPKTGEHVTNSTDKPFDHGGKQISLYRLPEEIKFGRLGMKAFIVGESTVGGPDVIGGDDENPYLSGEQKAPSSFFVSIDYEFPHLDSDLISANPFALRIINDLLPKWHDLEFHDENNEHTFAISHIAIFCRDGSKRGKIQVVIDKKEPPGLFIQRVTAGARNLAIASYIFSAIDTNIPIEAHQFISQILDTVLPFIELPVDSPNPSENAGAYVIRETNISGIVDPENAHAMIGKNDQGDSLINDDGTSNADAVLLESKREQFDEPFPPVESDEK